MSEHIRSPYELSPQGFRTCLEDLGLEYAAYVRPSVLYKNAVCLALEARAGERLIIKKSQQGAQPKGDFFQDLLMKVVIRANRHLKARQIDFNFNEYGDDMLRRRVISGRENGGERWPREGSLRLARLAFRHANEFTENIELEGKMGLNNQPATPDEIAEAFDYLSGATVLDQNSRPVDTLGSML